MNRRLILFILALATLLAYGFWAFSYDDAFITYRYAENLAATGHLEYNPGETVLGTTAPGWALVLAAASKASLEAVSVAGWGTSLSFLALASLPLTLASALRRHPAMVRVGLPALFGLLALTLRWNLEMLGAETMAVTALVPLGVLVALRGRGVLGGLLLAAATICRLDAALAAVLLLGLLAVVDRRLLVRAAAAFAIPVVLFLGGLQLHFGSFVPNTLDAKQSEVRGEQPSYGHTQRRWLRRTLPAPAGPVGVIALAAVALGAGVVRFRSRGAERRQRNPEGLAAAALGAWLVGHEIAYRLLGVPFAPWYHVPTINALVALAAAGALVVGTAAVRRLPVGARPIGGWLVGASLAVGVLQPGTFALHSWRQPPDPRYPALRRIGEQLALEAAPDASVAALEIGVIGAFAPQVRVLDLGGLVSPEVLAARQDDRLTDLLLRRRPEYLVDSTLFPGVFAPLLADERIIASYREVLRLPDGRGHELRLLRLKPATPAPTAVPPPAASGT